MTAQEKAALDSILQDDEFFKMMKEAQKASSYFQVSAAAGNSYFSVKNKEINATQLDNKFVFTASVAYYHKSGLALTASANLININGRSDFFQYMLNPSYNYFNSKTISFALSYTRYFRRSGYETYASPIQNDLYGSIYLKKPWIQPGISIGFANGKYTEYNKIDTVFLGVRRIFTDTAKTALSDFSMNAFVQHGFEFYGVFTKKDGATITSQVLLNAGSERFSATHQNPFLSKLKARPSGRFKNAGKQNANSSFSIQSVALSLDINYIRGKFGIETQAYFDYYLPESTDKKFTAIYSLVLSYTF